MKGGLTGFVHNKMAEFLFIMYLHGYQKVRQSNRLADDFPELEHEDIDAILAYAADFEHNIQVA